MEEFHRIVYPGEKQPNGDSDEVYSEDNERDNSWLDFKDPWGSFKACLETLSHLAVQPEIKLYPLTEMLEGTTLLAQITASILREGGKLECEPNPEVAEIDPYGYQGAATRDALGNGIIKTFPVKVKTFQPQPGLANLFNQIANLATELKKLALLGPKSDALETAKVEEEIDLQRSLKAVKVIRKMVRAQICEKQAKKSGVHSKVKMTCRVVTTWDERLGKNKTEIFPEKINFPLENTLRINEIPSTISDQWVRFHFLHLSTMHSLAMMKGLIANRKERTRRMLEDMSIFEDDTDSFMDSLFPYVSSMKENDIAQDMRSLSPAER